MQHALGFLHEQRIDRRVGEDARRDEAVRPAIDIERRAKLGDVPFRKRRGRAAKKQRFERLRGGVDEDRAGRREDARQLLAELFAKLVVEICKRLVEEHEIGALHDRARERRALLLSAGKLQRAAQEKRFELHQRRSLGDALLDLRLGGTGNAKRRSDVLVDGEVRVVDELLIDHRDRAGLQRRSGHVLAVEDDAPFGRPIEPGHQAHQAGLPRKGRPEQDIERSALEGQRHMVDVRLAVDALRDVVELERHGAPPTAAIGERAEAPFVCIQSSRRAAPTLSILSPSFERRQSTSSAVRAHSCAIR